MPWNLINKNGLWEMEGDTLVRKLRSFPDTRPLNLSDDIIVNLDRPDPVPAPVQRIWKKKGVLLERGHGPNPDGWEPGAVAHGRQEYELNGIAVEAARNYLVSKGIPVTITDSGSSLHAIGRLAQGYDVFVSVHHNSFNGSAQGVECLYHNVTGDPADRQLSELISDALSMDLMMTNRGAKPQALGVLSGAETTDTRVSVLAECYFMDALPSNHTAVSTRAGKAIGRAVESWLRANQ